MAVMGLFSGSFGRVLSQIAACYITAPRVGVILMIEAVIGSLLAFGFFGEIPHMASFVGGGVILVTIFIYALGQMKQEA